MEVRFNSDKKLSVRVSVTVMGDGIDDGHNDNELNGNDKTTDVNAVSVGKEQEKETEKENNSDRHDNVTDVEELTGEADMNE